VVKLTGISVAYGQRVLLDKADMLIRPQDRIGLVGPNGAGKSTLLKVIAREEKPDDGTLIIEGDTVIG